MTNEEIDEFKTFNEADTSDGAEERFDIVYTYERVKSHRHILRTEGVLNALEKEAIEQLKWYRRNFKIVKREVTNTRIVTELQIQD